MPEASPKGGELFIVDNSDENWKGLRYLEEWTEIARAFDIATGYFEIGALLALDGRWQKLDRIRILMGAEMTARTRQALLDGLRERVRTTLDQSLEAEKEHNDFLSGVLAIIEALRSGRIEARVYARESLTQRPNPLQRRHRPLPEGHRRPRRDHPPHGRDRQGHRPARRLARRVRSAWAATRPCSSHEIAAPRPRPPHRRRTAAGLSSGFFNG